ncbi:T9SS type B sorting domain-containing protein [Polaribacter sp. BAL334]|uniref:lectin-like domain-containing protein n=1 Tax=Polaribacter sp. BAL334 TaxID=1708178 RepID=UPI0018D21817|nr:T9SS type B sorting domain-containing protein [Polaribacter sp. BAL334]MBG7611648.1 T9SS type B sorting domain-containing protein [Polaribacter sp. BAL334]
MPTALAQINASLIGDAIDLGNNCYILTQDVKSQKGGVWYNNPIDFSKDFAIYYQANFGSKNSNGADGMALVFKGNPQPELGNDGGGLSYQGITPSLIVEFDTWQNSDFGDPIFDHISIMKNGDANHSNPVNNLAGPVQASLSNPNIEDGSDHEVKIEWFALQQVLIVYFDCIPRIQITMDIKASIFGGDDSVYFGFVSSTGGNSNLHQVCLNRVSFVDNLQLQDVTICEGESSEIDATIASGVSYSWSPRDGVSNPNSANPVFSPNETTTYTVTIEDVCGDVIVEEVTVTIASFKSAIFDSIDPICEGDIIDPLPTTSKNNITGFWTPQLNNTTTTTYTFIPFSDPCVTTTTLEVIVNPLVIPSFDAIAPICKGDLLTELPTMSNNGISGIWSPSLNNTSTTLYTFTPNPDQGCVANGFLEIIVNQIEIPQFDFETTICEGTSFEFPSIANNGIEGEWSPEFNAGLSQVYTFTPIDESCVSSISIAITIKKRIIPEFSIEGSICEGQNIAELPSISNNGVEGFWTPEVNNTTTTLYTFTPYDFECALSTTHQIIVNSNILPLFDDIKTSSCFGETLDELPTQSANGIVGTWLPALNNQLTTTYTFTPDEGQNCVLETTITIVITEPIVPIFDSISPICEGETLEALPQISKNQITGSWFPELNNLETTTYTFIPNLGQCANQTTLKIEVLPITELVVDIMMNSDDFSDNQAISIDVKGGTGSYEYQLDELPWQTNNSFSGITGCGEHLVKVRELSKCSNIAIQTFKILEYPKFFTPNGDDKNDTWNIECLKNQTEARITIFNRYGKMVAIINPSLFGWDGKFNNKLMPSNDYWFQAEYLGNDGKPKLFTSHFSLIR